ncbi:Geranylgeranyl pyrophosphate synthase [Nymphon striatum]|nr:Geranylgeranyl pyrophosphate synthase [Nymphon striatum]
MHIIDDDFVLLEGSLKMEIVNGNSADEADSISKQDEILLQPFKYISQESGKQFRAKLAKAFNYWLKIPSDKLTVITDVIQMLHNASLLIDDIEDNSKLRRGIPVAHHIYGVPSTINSANYVYFLGLQKVLTLNNAQAVSVFTDQLLELHRGQGMEIFWRDNFICPTEEQYKDMTIRTHNVPGQFLMAALDNLNFHSETEDRGNVDATTNIIYQYSSGEETADCVNFLGSIEFLMRESGIEEVLVASETCGRVTANKVMSGKDYYKMARCHSWLGKVFFMLKTDCEQQDKDSVVRHVGHVRNHLNSLLIVWEEFENSLGKTAKLWEMYIDMVLIFKRYINAERALEATPHVVDAKQLGLDVIAHARSTDAEKIISPKILTFAGQQKQTKKRQDSLRMVKIYLYEPDKAGYKMRKGNKADFLDTLQNKVSETWKLLEELPPSALTPVYVIDAMTSVQRFQTLGQIQPTSGKIQRQDYENETCET